MTASSSSPQRRRRRTTAAAAAALLFSVSFATGASGPAPSSTLSSLSETARGTDDDGDHNDNNVPLGPPPPPGARRRERRRRLGVHRYLDERQRSSSSSSTSGRIYNRAGRRGDKAVDYGPRPTPRRRSDERTGSGGRRTGTTAAGGYGGTAGAGGDEGPEAYAAESSVNYHHDDPAPRSRARSLETDASGGTFGPWWYEPDWSFDSYVSSLGKGLSDEEGGWSYPPVDVYTYDPEGKIFPEWFDWTLYRPIRIRARYYDLPPDEPAKNAFLTNQVFPAAIQFWTKALMVYPARRIYVNTDNCQMAEDDDWKNGLTDTDLILYVRAEKDCGDGSFAAAGSCDWDEFDKPTAGVIEFCYNKMELEPDGTFSPRTLRIFVETAIHELAHVLGFDSADMPFYFDRATGQPRTLRPIDLTPDFDCVLPGQREEVYLPSETTVRERTNQNNIRYFEVVTPTVARVAKNHFNCEDVEGIRLENQPTAEDCFGDHFEERLVWNDVLSAIATTPSIPEYLSPMLLALLEDTGWYRANYALSRIPPFGHGAGCPFVAEPCIDGDGNVPPHNEEFFCNTADYNVYHCDPSHNVLANCDLKDFSTFGGGSVTVPPEMQLFDDPNLGGKTVRSDFCPVYGDFVLSCRVPVPDRMSNMKVLPEESFAADARCFDSDDYERPFCLTAVCNAELRRAQVIVGGEAITCEDVGGTKNVPLAETGFTFNCPPLAVVCPELVCPANCAGRGVCRWDDETPRCDCFEGSGGGEACFSYRVGYDDDDGGGGGEVPGPSTRPPTGQPTVGDGGGSSTVEDFYGCRDWCADLPNPWRSDDPTAMAKCTWWTYACSQCPECQTTEVQ